MTQQTDNVLVSREWVEAMESFIRDLHNSHIEWDLFDPRTMGKDINVRLKEILSMPDSMKSERDVEVVRAAIQVYANQSSPNMSDHVSRLRSQAAINALRYRKDGE